MGPVVFCAIRLYRGRNSFLCYAYRESLVFQVHNCHLKPCLQRKPYHGLLGLQHESLLRESAVCASGVPVHLLVCASCVPVSVLLCSFSATAIGRPRTHCSPCSSPACGLVRLTFRVMQKISGGQTQAIQGMLRSKTYTKVHKPFVLQALSLGRDVRLQASVGAIRAALTCVNQASSKNDGRPKHMLSPDVYWRLLKRAKLWRDGGWTLEQGIPLIRRSYRPVQQHLLPSGISQSCLVAPMWKWALP